MQPAEQNFDVGVLVGRFQVHELHEGHWELLQHVNTRHEKVIVFLGISPLDVSANNPLDFEARKQMILEAFPHFNVLYVPDQPTDDGWSKHLDAQIKTLVAPSQSVVLYGGRDSFIDRYSGKHETQELLQTTHYSGRAQRKAIARSRAKASPEFRAGVIWASQNRYPTVYTTVDVAILKADLADREPVPASESWKSCRVCQPRTACDLHKAEAAAYFEPYKQGEPRPTQLLLGRKANEKLYRFIGGFSDPRSNSFEDDAKREVREETGLEVGDLRFLGSLTVDDWRYRAEPDCIRTMLFTAKYLHGRPEPRDDIEEVKWFNLSDHASLTPQVVPEHRPLMVMLLNHVNRKES